MSNRRKLRQPRGFNRFGESYLLTRKKRKLAIQLQQEHNRQGNARAREISQTAASIETRLASGEITPTEAQAELTAAIASSRKR